MCVFEVGGDDAFLFDKVFKKIKTITKKKCLCVKKKSIEKRIGGVFSKKYTNNEKNNENL